MKQFFMPNNQKSSIFKNNKLPSLAYFCAIDNEPNWSHPLHNHEDLSEIIYICSGEGTFIVDNKTYIGKEGDIILYNNGVLHHDSSNPDNPLKSFVCGIKDLYLVGIEDNCLLPKYLQPLVKAGDHSDTIKMYLNYIFNECRSQEKDYEIICDTILISLISLIKRISYSNPNIIKKESTSLAFKIKEFLNENYRKDISLKELSDHFFISTYYLSHIFKKEIGFSPIQYIINRRIGEAQKLLLSSEMSVSDISEHVGYENHNYFNVLFKKTYGISPGKFRELSRICLKPNLN